VQIRSAVFDIFHTQTHTHKTKTDGAKNRTSRNSLRAANSRDSRVLLGQNSKSCTVLYGTCWNHQLMVHDWLVYILTNECAGYFQTTGVTHIISSIAMQQQKHIV